MRLGHLICVTDVFGQLHSAWASFHLETAGESAAAASAQAGNDQALDDIVRSHLGMTLPRA